MAAVDIQFPGNIAQVSSAADLRALPSYMIESGTLYVITSLGRAFRYDTGSVAVDDGTNVIKPNDRTTLQAGRWLYELDGFAPGPPGTSDNTYSPDNGGLTAFKASDIARKVARLNGISGVPDGNFNWTLGNFTGQADDINIIKADSTALSVGAWVRQRADSVTYRAPVSTPASLPANAAISRTAYLTDWSGDFDSEHLNRAMTEFAALGGGTLHVPPGVLTIDATVTIPEKVQLQGSLALCSKAAAGPNADFANYRMNVTVGQGATTTPAIIMKTNSGIAGFTMFWPAQSKTAAAVPFGWAITSDGSPFGFDRVSIRNMMLTNPYWGINADGGGQWLVEDVYGQPLRKGVRVDRMLDRSVIRNVHWWTFFSIPGEVLFNDVRANSIGFDIGKADDLIIDTPFAYGLNRLMSFDDFGSGSAWAKVVNGQADVCEFPVVINKANKLQFSVLGLITNAGAQTGAPGIYFGPDVQGEVVVNGATVYNAFIGARVMSNTGRIAFTNFVCQRSGRTDDVKQYDIVVEGGASVHIDDVPAPMVAGGASVRVGNFTLPPASVDITPSGFGTPYSWASNPAVVNNGGNSDFDLSAAVNGTTQFAVPQSLVQEQGPFVLVVPIQWFPGPNGYGPGQFYLRLSDGATRNNQVFPPNGFDGHFREQLSLNVPFLLRGDPAGLVFQFVFGGGLPGNIMRLGPMRIFRADYRLLSRGAIDWLHTTTPNTAADPLGVDFIAGNRVTRRNAAPTAGTHRTLDRTINVSPVTGQPVAWTCSAGGTPGTWLAEGNFA